MARLVTWRAALAGGLSVAAISAVGFALIGTGDSDSADPTPPAATASAAPVPAQLVPTSVTIPNIDAKSTLVPLGLNADGTVQVPDVHTPRQAGYFTNGVVPGQPGPLVLLGHVDGDGILGIFHDIGKLSVGAAIQVGRSDGSTATYKVTKVETVTKATFPQLAVYGKTSDAQIRLVTCGGPFDKAAKSYKDSVIVFGVLA